MVVGSAVDLPDWTLSGWRGDCLGVVMAAKLRRAAAGGVEEVGALAAACDDESREGNDRGAAVRNILVVDVVDRFRVPIT